MEIYNLEDNIMMVSANSAKFFYKINKYQFINKTNDIPKILTEDYIRRYGL